ncbi:MAG TPA: acyl carrier protein [Acidimicrobiia bacterium]|nr:acyl carrier protein [Acidimicrobiia bacterium]
MTSTFDAARVPDLVRAELAAVTGEPLDVFADDALLGAVGLDSLLLIEALVSVRDQILDEVGLSADDVGDPPTLPWMETIGELIEFVRSSVPAEMLGDGGPRIA